MSAGGGALSVWSPEQWACDPTSDQGRSDVTNGAWRPETGKANLWWEHNIPGVHLSLPYGLCDFLVVTWMAVNTDELSQRGNRVSRLLTDLLGDEPVLTLPRPQ